MSETKENELIPDDSAPKTSPLDNLINEARDITAAYDKHRFESDLMSVYLKNGQDYINEVGSYITDTTGRYFGNVEKDLDARLVKQAQALDSMHDLFLHLSQYALAQDRKSLHGYINIALRTEAQSAATIEKFKKLREKRYS